MAGDTKERIMEVALALFSRTGYLGTSMQDIAQQLGVTKAALYKHYAGKQELLDCIVARMNAMDYARAAEYEMPETEPDGFAEAYRNTPLEKIRARFGVLVWQRASGVQSAACGRRLRS